MIGQKMFEDSVDLDTPLTVDFEANPKWPRRQLCWEAKGSVARKYAQLEREIAKVLNQSVN